MSTDNIGVVGLWHLGCVVSACWSKLGKNVRGVEFNPALIKNLSAGNPPLYEPGLAELIQAGLKAKTLSYSDQPSTLSDCKFVFLTYDTPVRDDDSSDLTLLEEAVEKIAPRMADGAILVVSAQLPAGTARKFRARLKTINKTLELVYSPENLQLGRAIDCYLKPGHIVIGADSTEAGDAVEKLFAPMAAQALRMNLTSGEMAKHGINSFLAMSITFANQLADLCSASGADFYDVAKAMKHDARIGQKAYLSAGVGFSGGTLGRDLKVLDGINSSAGKSSALFGGAWTYNKRRIKLIAESLKEILGTLDGKTIGLLGMTYKPGTSTLRRSLPLEIALELATQGARIQAYDPKADWKEIAVPKPVQVVSNAQAAAEGADLVALLTEWPEFKDLDYKTLKNVMKGAILYDPKNVLAERVTELESTGWRVVILGRAEAEGSKEKVS